MTTDQRRLYFFEWNRARTWYQGHGYTDDQAEAKRHALHQQALGCDKSSKDLTNADLDKVLAAFRGVSDGGNLEAQLRQIEQPELRCRELRHKARDLASWAVDRSGTEGAYLDGMARKIFGARDYGQLTERQLQQLCGILARRKRQKEQIAADRIARAKGNPF